MFFDANDVHYNVITIAITCVMWDDDANDVHYNVITIAITCVMLMWVDDDDDDDVVMMMCCCCWGRGC